MNWNGEKKMNEEDKAHVLTFDVICKDCKHVEIDFGCCEEHVNYPPSYWCNLKAMWVGGMKCTEYEKDKSISWSEVKIHPSTMKDGVLQGYTVELDEEEIDMDKAIDEWAGDPSGID